MGWDVPGARRLRLARRDGPTLVFEVEGSSRAARTVLADWVLVDGRPTAFLRSLSGEGRLKRWELLGLEGAEGEFDEKGALAVGRSWRGEEQTVTLRAYDEGGRPQLRFHKYRRGKKIGVRVVTLDSGTLKATQIRDYDSEDRLLRIARLTPEAEADITEPGRTLAFASPAKPPTALPSAAKPAPPPRPPAPKPAKAQPRPPVPKGPESPSGRPKPKPPPAAKPAPPRPISLAAPPGTLLAEAPDGSFSTADAVLRRFGPAVGGGRSIAVAGPAGLETWLVRRDEGKRALERAEVVNELVMREVLRSLYAEVFEAAPAVGFEAGGRAALLERAPEDSTVGKSFRPPSPRERAALATLSLIFGLADRGPDRIGWREGRKPQLSGLRAVRREPRKPAGDETPLLSVEIRLGRVPFIRFSPSLPREDYEEEARRVSGILASPGFGDRFRERLTRAGLSAEEAKAYWDSARANSARFDALLEPYLEAASALEELTDAGR